MRIMHIISSLETGGAQAVLHDLIEGFAHKGYVQTIVYFHDGPYRARLESLGIALHHVPLSVWALFRIMRLMRSFKPDCIHSVLWAANVLSRSAARALSIPCINALHNNRDHNGFIRTVIDTLIPTKWAHAVAVSQEVSDSFEGFFAEHTIIPNGIDSRKTAELARRTTISRQSLGLDSSNFVIGTVGRFAQVKRYPFLLDAFAKVVGRYPHAILLIVGQGSEQHSIQAYAESLGLSSNIRWIIGKQAYQYYPLLDCFVMASKMEGISIALLEAMSLGIVPVVTYHSLQHPVITNGENGYVAECNNATDLTNKLADLIDEKSDALTAGKRAQQTVRDSFAFSCTIASYDRMFEHLSNMKCAVEKSVRSRHVESIDLTAKSSQKDVAKMREKSCKKS